LALAVLVLAFGGAAQAAEARATPSGLPVPRWVTLKFGTVNARGGPGDDHRKLWVYRVKGLPVQVVAETRDWRRICDAEGGLAWVHKRTVDGTRGVLNLTRAPVALQGRAEAGSPAKAYLAAGALAKLNKCKDGWCRIEAGKAKGWAPAQRLWGADEGAVRCKVAVRR
jgi:SH3-like domain-containing protein